VHDRPRVVPPEQLKTNLLALIEALNKAKPQGVKGIYLKKVSVSRRWARRARRSTASRAQQSAGAEIAQSKDLRERRAATRRRPSKTAGANA
jgi:hypothetical protein